MFARAGVPDIYGFSLGQVFDLYMVDVHGERVVIDAFHFAGTSCAALQRQDYKRPPVSSALPARAR